ncbi:MAG: response regulator [Desulfobacterota bacterium]|nr:response regulator [Thermodesulfobacteriota bacterium]
MADVIVIDDDHNILVVLAGMLKKAGHTVRTAHDGSTGFALFKERKPDLLITDIVMPEKDGMEIIAEIRRSARDVKIIAISGGSDFIPDHYLDTAQLFGADRILKKPFTLQELTAIINELMVHNRPL